MYPTTAAFNAGLKAPSRYTRVVHSSGGGQLPRRMERGAVTFVPFPWMDGKNQGCATSAADAYSLMLDSHNEYPVRGEDENLHLSARMQRWGCPWGWRGDRGEDYGPQQAKDGQDANQDRSERAKNSHSGLPTCNPEHTVRFRKI